MTATDKFRQDFRAMMTKVLSILFIVWLLALCRNDWQIGSGAFERNSPFYDINFFTLRACTWLTMALLFEILFQSYKILRTLINGK